MSFYDELEAECNKVIAAERNSKFLLPTAEHMQIVFDTIIDTIKSDCVDINPNKLVLMQTFLESFYSSFVQKFHINFRKEIAEIRNEDSLTMADKKLNELIGEWIDQNFVKEDKSVPAEEVDKYIEQNFNKR